LSEPSIASASCILFAYHEMGYACMEALLEIGAPVAALFTHQDSGDEEIWWRSCAALAESRGIPIYTPEAVDATWVARIAALEPAALYSFSYRNLLSERVLRLASIAALNLHPSLLPRYRGRAPVNWVLVNGERETGVTLHHMVARADAGDIVAQRAASIDDDDTALTLYRKLVPLGAGLVRESHPLIVAGRAPRHPQDLSQGNYCGRRRPDDGRIDWNWPARRIFNLVRAVTHPYPGAFCFESGRKLYVWKAGVAHEHERRGEAGALVDELDDGSLEIAAGEGSVLVVRAQFENHQEGRAREVLEASAVAGALKLS